MGSPESAIEFLERAVKYKKLISEIFGRSLLDTNSGYPMNSNTGSYSSYSHDMGYRAMACKKCFSTFAIPFSSFKEILKDVLHLSERIEHKCDQYRKLDDAFSNESIKNNVIDAMVKSLPGVIAVQITRCGWLSKRPASITAVKLPNSINKLFHLDTNTNTSPFDIAELTISDKTHWGARAIERGRAPINANEFTDFLEKVKDATFGVFRIIKDTRREMEENDDLKEFSGQTLVRRKKEMSAAEFGESVEQAKHYTCDYYLMLCCPYDSQ